VILAQGRQVALVEIAEQIVDGVQHRRRVGFDRDAVATPHEVEEERRHDGDD
jgi:hypothetical protein